MCLEDIRLGRDLAVQSNVFAVPATTWTLLTGKDPMRTRAGFGCDNVNTVFIQFGEVAPAGAQQCGYALVPQSPNLTVRVEELGKLLQSNIWVFTPGLGCNLYTFFASLEKP